MIMIKKIILASSSPRRKEILAMLGLPFEVVSPDADEEIKKELSPEEYVCTLSERKGEAARMSLLEKGENLDNALIISCDTIVYYNGMVIGKPQSELHAALTLGVLSDSWHTVYSGLTLQLGDCRYSESCATNVKFAAISERQINDYVRSGEPMGKAGSYAVQARGAELVERIEGDFFNVMGLPVSTLSSMLKKHFGTDALELSFALKGEEK